MIFSVVRFVLVEIYRLICSCSPLAGILYIGGGNDVCLWSLPPRTPSYSFVWMGVGSSEFQSGCCSSTRFGRDVALEQEQDA